MRHFLRVVGLLLALAHCLAAQAQKPREEAEAKGMAASKLIDEGKLDEAIGLLQEARRLDPGRSAYPYELAYAYYQQKKYPQALELAEPLLRLSDASDRTFELVGNLYDVSGQPALAVQTYEAGLRKFPQTGRMQLELGIMAMGQQDYEKAIDYFEAGIAVAPTLSSNYYWAAKLFCNSSEAVWGVQYGELFVNLERNSDRTYEISKLLYDTYRAHITLKGPDTVAVSFSKNNVIRAPAKGKKLHLPYGTLVYEPVLLVAITGQKTIDLDALDAIRSNFVDVYYQLPVSKEKPNVVVEWQRQIKQAGFLGAYNHWLLLAGDEAGFKRWEKANPLVWQGFVDWFKAHPLQLSQKHYFSRLQYE